ncbi:hypothetical protein ACFCW2_06010 [Qipengyuania sp. DSG2-2]|uniref:hypothetical protein n=1 Tax=Qipengyuania sp. DGS2-2 TaxID=3349631 RepID=UPI0036D26DAA
MSPDPWKILGIGPTSDAYAIHDAYRRKLAKLKLDTPAERYSQLMHARTDALKQAQNAQTGVSDRTEATETAAVSETNRTDQSERAFPASPRVVLVGSEDQKPPKDASGPASREHPPAFATQPFFDKLDRFRLYAAGVGLLLVGIFMLTEVVDDFREGWNDAGAYYDEYEPLPDGPARDRADAAAVQLFGTDVTWRQVEEADPWMAGALVRRVAWDEENDLATSVAEARSSLRLAMLFSRLDLPRSDVVAVNRLYLGWLKTALTQEDGACREVTGRAFFDGIPRMGEEALSKERQLVWRLIRDESLHYTEGEIVPLRFPQDILEAASENSGVGVPALRRSMSEITEPGNCAATIAILEATLDQGEDAPIDLLRGI